MRKTILSIFLALISAFTFAQTKPSISFEKFRNENIFSETMCELNNLKSVNRRQWIDDRLERESVIQFCDSIINIAWNSLLTYDDYKQSVKDKVPDSLASPTLFLLMQSEILDDTIIKSLRDTSAQGIIEKNSYTVLGKWMLLQFVDPLIDFLSLDNYSLDEDEIRMNLSVIQNLYSMQLLNNNYEYKMRNGSLNIPDEMQLRNKRLIAERLSIVESRLFVFYQSSGAHNRKAESIDMFMDNDFFAPGGHNQDREYTGGGAISISTDYFKFRFIKFGWAFKNVYEDHVLKCSNDKPVTKKVILNRGEALAYQSIKLGMHFYTPYIRYRDNIKLADTLFQYDRPFGSYIYLERSKYRIWPKGLVRQQGNFQVGKIGTNAGRDIQALLHRDAVTTSQKVYGWQNQIANGGRWLIQLNQRYDLMLFSSSNRFASIFRPSNLRPDQSALANYFGFNIYNSSEIFWGGYYSAFGSGLFVSLLDFTKQSGQNFLVPFRPKSIRVRNYEFGVNVEAGLRYRYVAHNSMLEGFGYMHTFKDDDYDDEATSSYVLTGNQIVRNIWIAEFKLLLRWRKMNLYYNMCIQTKEYKIAAPEYSGFPGSVAISNLNYYNAANVTELTAFNSYKMYGYGRVGVVWLIE